MMVAALEHGSGLVLGQLEVDSKSNEIPAVRALSAGLDLAGRIVTVDALHAQQQTAHYLIDECNADYLVTAIKDNQPTMHKDLKAIDWSNAPWHETVDKGHGRIEHRRCAVVDLSGAERDGYANLYGRRQALRIDRDREIIKTGERSVEVTCSLTSLGAERAGPRELLTMVRRHWHIENRLHYVRDFTYDEDRCRAYVRHMPRNLACLSNAAIAIVRCNGRFRYLRPKPTVTMPHERRRPSIRSWARPPPDPAAVTTYRVCRVAPPSDPRQLCARRYQKLRSAGTNGPHHVVEPNCRPPESPPAYPLFLIPQAQPGQKNFPGGY